ncbi:hypothetical protein [Klebsiella phage vB_KpnS-VAC2]|uniref:Uncharacterized protein n=1 Tax=Klebsiella phage vB_KpnS-VAC2 TaxID=2864369 RepID=A0AAE7XHC4_9CAUD|nr:hypothetical protein [Klebsiella phage vB_KpnS-VAC2]
MKFPRSKWAVISAAGVVRSVNESVKREGIVDRHRQRYWDYLALKAMIGQAIERGVSDPFQMQIWHETTIMLNVKAGKLSTSMRQFGPHLVCYVNECSATFYIVE